MNDQTQANAPKKYKKWLKTLEEMRGESGVSAYNRAAIAKGIYDDEEFKQDFSEQQAADILDSMFQDLCLCYYDMARLLDRYPEKDDWKDGKLRTMYETMVKEGRAKSKKDSKSSKSSKRQRWAISHSDHQKVVDELAAVKAADKQRTSEIASLRDQLARANQMIDSLTEDRRVLTEENRRLISRIEALESLREAAVA